MNKAIKQLFKDYQEASKQFKQNPSTETLEASMKLARGIIGIITQKDTSEGERNDNMELKRYTRKDTTPSY